MPRRGFKTVARGKRSAAPGWRSTGNQAPAGAAEVILIEGILSPLPWLNPFDSHYPGLRFAGPGLLSERRSAARLRFFHTFLPMRAALLFVICLRRAVQSE